MKPEHQYATAAEKDFAAKDQHHQVLHRHLGAGACRGDRHRTLDRQGEAGHRQARQASARKPMRKTTIARPQTSCGLFIAFSPPCSRPRNICRHHPCLPAKHRHGMWPNDKLVAIATSTGILQALDTVLRMLPKEVPASSSCSTCRPSSRRPSLSDWTRTGKIHACARRRTATASNRTPQLIAPGGKTWWRRRPSHYYVDVVDGPPVDRHWPSVDVLSDRGDVRRTVGHRHHRDRHGDDGARGLKMEMEEAGAHTVAWDEKTCVVFGMPKVAIERAASADPPGPLDRITKRSSPPDALAALWRRAASVRRRRRWRKRRNMPTADQPLRLFFQAFPRPAASTSAAFCVRDLVHLAHGQRRLIDPARLLALCATDFLYERATCWKELTTADRIARLANDPGTVLHRRHRFADQALDLFGSIGTALREATPRSPRRRSRVPYSPARAASTAALRARMLVWKAIESMTPMMSLILRASSARSPPSWRPPTAPARRHAGEFVRGFRQFAGLPRVIGILADGRVQFLHARRGFLEAGRPLLGAR